MLAGTPHVEKRSSALKAKSAENTVRQVLSEFLCASEIVSIRRIVQGYVQVLPRPPSYLNSGLLGYVTIGYIEPRTHYLGNWEP